MQNVNIKMKNDKLKCKIFQYFNTLLIFNRYF